MSVINEADKINICFAVDDNYAPYLAVSLYSLLQNRNRDFFYNIIIMYATLTRENLDRLLVLTQAEEDVVVRFVDITDISRTIEYKVGTYLSEATIYRLMLFTDDFDEYDKILYLDCDTITEGDISELYFNDLDGCLVGAVEETGFRQLSYSKKAVFIDGCEPYNVDNYRTDALCMKYPNSYFNAGVILFDLEKCHKKYSYEDVLNILHSKQFFYNDQDVLNILFDGCVKMLDVEWNYQNNVEIFCNYKPELYEPMYRDVRRQSPKIIHYVSAHKPWKEDVVLSERYHLYEKKCSDFLKGCINNAKA